MKTKIIVALLVLVGLGAGLVWWKQGGETPIFSPAEQETDPVSQDMAAIRQFMAEPNLELSFVRTDLPMPYFRVGKVTKTAGGENMEAVEDWTHKVNVYHQKELLGNQCATYEYHVDPRSHSVTAVVTISLKPKEIEEYKAEGVECETETDHDVPELSAKADAESIAMEYLKRVLPNFDQIKDEFAYSHDKMHTWLWEDKDYQLPAGLEGRPYSHPVVRISVDNSKGIMYWNTVPLFEN